MLYCASRPLGRWIRYGTRPEDFSTAIIEGSPLDRSFLSILILVGLLILARRKVVWRDIVKGNRWLFLLFLYMLVSVVWSDYPFVSLKRWIRASGGIVMALVVLTGPSPSVTMEAVLRRTIYVLIPFSALFVKYYPNLGVQWHRWSGQSIWIGAAMSKNTLGALCMISALFLIWAWARRKKGHESVHSGKYETIRDAILLGLTLWLLRGPGAAYSATSIALLIVGLGILLMLRRMSHILDYRCMAFLFLIVAGLGYALTWGLSINPPNLVASWVGRDATLTGRVDIWAHVMEDYRQHQVVGVGYGGYWIEPLVIGRANVCEAHNGYLDILIELGALGLFLFSVATVAFFRKSGQLYMHDVEWGSFIITVLLISLVHNITESSLLKSNLLVWNVLLFFMVVVSQARESDGFVFSESFTTTEMRNGVEQSS
jgi:O-antigen ligase